MIRSEQLLAVETINRYYSQYGEKFLWRALSYDDEYYVGELKKELPPDDPFLSYEMICAAARSITDDDVLYIAEDSEGRDYWRLYHLTYSSVSGRSPEYKEFSCRTDAMAFIKENAAK